jgi:twitching motility protein PilT
MAQQEQGGLLGRLAVHYKLISLDQLAEATREQARQGAGKKLGDVLVEKGLLRPSQLEQLLHVQKEILAKQQAGGTPGTARPAVGAARPPEASSVPAARAQAPAPPAQPAVHDAAQDAAADAAAALRAVTPAARVPDAAPPPLRSASAPAAARPAAAASGTGLAPTPVHVADPGRRGELHAHLEAAVAAGASDVHVHSGGALLHRTHGKLAPAGPVIDAGLAEALVFSILSEEQTAVAREHGELDFSYSLSGVGRFRANVYRQQRGWDAVFRAIPPTPPTLDQLGLPASFAKLTNYHQGMVLVTGPAGCGKSSTMAALVNLVNEERRDHILTIEDPIEYLHPSKRCLVNQRNVKRHTESFARALRAALREDPDVIVIGELRDLETISLAMTAAETGHFVLATLHTNDTIRTINRLVGAFPSDQQGQVRTMLSESMRAVISQRLVAAADGTRRVPAYELLMVNKAVGNLIRESKTFQIRSILQTGAAQGMHLLDQHLAQLVAAGTITKEEAARHVEDPKKLGAAGA